MKTITPELQAHLEGEVTTLATIWRITRTDGANFYFTDHDQNITFDGNIYEASSGYNRSAMDNKSGLPVDNLNILGFFDNDAITETDLRGGLFDFAEVRIGMVNYRDLTQGQMRMKRGKLGEVVYSESTGVFNTELRGLTQLYSQGALELYQSQCRADLGDARCKVPLSPDVMLPTTAYSSGTRLRGSTLLNGESSFTFLAHFDETADDQSANQAVATLGPEAALNTEISKFGAGSIEFSPTSTSFPADAFVSYPDNDIYNLGTDQFTIECFVRFKDLTAPEQTIISHSSWFIGERSWYLRRNLGNLEFVGYANGSAIAGSVAGAFSWAVDTWYHVAVTRDASNDVRIFVDGVQVGATTPFAFSFFDPETDLRIGKREESSGGDEPLFGFVDEARIEVGTAFYTANFSPPTEAFESLTDKINALTTPDFNDRLFEVTTAGTTGETYPVFNLTPGSTTAWGSVVFTAREAFSRSFVVAAVLDRRNFSISFPNGEDSREVDNWFKYGAVKWESGENNGLGMEVKTYVASSNDVELFLEMPFTILPGDTGFIYAGCDKLKDTCINKFANIINYRGEPYVPGQDEFLSYPDAR